MQMAQPRQELGGGTRQQGVRKCEIRAESWGGGGSTKNRGAGRLVRRDGVRMLDRGLSRE